MQIPSPTGAPFKKGRIKQNAIWQFKAIKNMAKKILGGGMLLVFGLAVLPLGAEAACAKVSGKTYYTDSVSYFSDAACRDEMTAAQLSDGTGSTSSGTGYISTGNGNCRYSLAKKLYTDGVADFLDNKCAEEAVEGDTVTAPATATAQTATTAQTTAQVAAATAQTTQLSQRIAALENKVSVLAAMISKILAILAQK